MRAVAISTTGEAHRMAFLETAIERWSQVLESGDRLFITVDGNADDAERARMVAFPWTDQVYRVGQKLPGVYADQPRMGVAVNKNTGLELMMDAGADHLFLSDDDTYPLLGAALDKHTSIAARIPHSMVCWGAHRLAHTRGRYATWNWPRGVMLYSTRAVVAQVGGMLEAFGDGGHEHAEWSRRIHQHGLTPHPYCSPRQYAERGLVGKATRAGVLWHCEDMRRTDETSVQLGHRRKAITTLSEAKDWARANALLGLMDGNTAYIPFASHQNRRASATLCATSTSRGAEGDQ